MREDSPCSKTENKPNYSLHSNLDNTMSLTLHCMLVNARSLNTTTVDNLLNILFVEEKIYVCCITATWLKPGHQAVLTDIKLKGNEIISSLRAKHQKGGGVASLGTKK